MSVAVLGLLASLASGNTLPAIVCGAIALLALIGAIVTIQREVRRTIRH